MGVWRKQKKSTFCSGKSGLGWNSWSGQVPFRIKREVCQGERLCCRNCFGWWAFSLCDASRSHIYGRIKPASETRSWEQDNPTDLNLVLACILASRPQDSESSLLFLPHYRLDRWRSHLYLGRHPSRQKWTRHGSKEAGCQVSTQRAYVF